MLPLRGLLDSTPVFDLNSLNPQQRQAVEAIHGPVLILAGAGTGKTRVITCRIVHLMRKGISPDHILAVTFTNKAAREMQERVREMLPRAPRNQSQISNLKSQTSPDAPAPRPTLCTFHSLCVRILRQHIEKLGYKRNFVIYDESDQLSAIKKILAGISAKGEKADAYEVLSLLSRLRNGGERAAIFGDPSVRALAEHVRKRYESALRACNAVDFDDLILLTLRLFTEHPEALAACRDKYRHVMVDEYQDTNAAQFELVHALTREHRHLCVVGDDDQSIYGWRGAEVANLLDMEKHYPEVKVIKLEQNYRSTTTILSAANAVIKHNVRRRSKQLWSQKGVGQKIVLHAFPNDDDEAREIVTLIEFNRLAHRIPWREHAILFRTNQQSRPLETALRQGNVRYHLIGGQSFFDRREIRDFLAYLKALVNPHDDVSLLRIANVPARGLSDVTMERLLGASHERKGSVFAAMQNPSVITTFQARTRESIEAFAALIEARRAQLNAGEVVAPQLQSQISNLKSQIPPVPAAPRGFSLAGWAESFLNDIGYFTELRRGEKDPQAAENRVKNLRELIATMDNYGSAADAPAARLELFLEGLTLDSDRESEDDEPGDAVTLITMHSCKGLEFPHVFIVGLEDGLLPHTRSKTEGTVDEERRLFYVAVTRAMKTLAISHCLARKKYGQLQPCHPSPFLSELPEQFVEHADAKAKEPVTVESAKLGFAAMRAVLG